MKPQRIIQPHEIPEIRDEDRPALEAGLPPIPLDRSGQPIGRWVYVGDGLYRFVAHEPRTPWWWFCVRVAFWAMFAVALYSLRSR